MDKHKKENAVDSYTVCPYCMWPGSADNGVACCGEVHFEKAYEFADDSLLLESELDRG